MADSNLNTSTSAVISRVGTLISSASAEELLKLCRTNVFLDQTENATLEVAVDSRVSSLTSTATASDLSKLGRAVGLMLDPVYTATVGEIIPSQTGSANTFLSTDGNQDEWNGVVTRNITEIGDEVPNDNDILLYDGTSKFDSNIPQIQSVATSGDIPVSGSVAGQVIHIQADDTFQIWNGTSWG